MSEEEVHFIETCCRILKVSDDERVKFITIKAVNKGNEDPGLTIVAIGKMLEALGNKAEAFRRASPLAEPLVMQTTWSPLHASWSTWGRVPTASRMHCTRASWWVYEWLNSTKPRVWKISG